MNKYCHILKANTQLSKIFENHPIISSKQTKSLHELIGGNTLRTERYRKKLKRQWIVNAVNFTVEKTMCFNQVTTASSFKSYTN